MYLPTLLALTSLPALLTAAFPNAPFTTSGRWIHDSTGENFTFAGVNWPGAGEVMIPEGLQYQSIANIVTKIKSLKMNIVRLTFAIEMIDDIKDNGGDVTVQKAFTKALGASNGEKVWQQVLKNNPGFSTSTTRVQVFDAVAAELNKQGIYVHLDNHMSKGAWCCGGADGNAWFGDRYFDTAKWKRGVTYMAEHGKAWPNLVSIGLRNEFRKPDSAGSSLAYTWPVWYDQNIPLANSVNAANPNILIFLSGLDYDTKVTPLPNADDLGNGKKFLLTDFKYANKLVLELHNYQNSATNCGDIESGLWNNGFKATGEKPVNKMPVVLTEFGFSQAGSDYNGVYATCIKKLMPQWKTGWTVWVLLGKGHCSSELVADLTFFPLQYEETWGLLNHQWSDWRSSSAITALKGMIDASLKG